MYSKDLSAVIEVVDSDNAGDVASLVNAWAKTGLALRIAIGTDEALFLNFSRFAAIEFSNQEPNREVRDVTSIPVRALTPPPSL